MGIFYDKSHTINGTKMVKAILSLQMWGDEMVIDDSWQFPVVSHISFSVGLTSYN